MTQFHTFHRKNGHSPNLATLAKHTIKSQIFREDDSFFATHLPNSHTLYELSIENI